MSSSDFYHVLTLTKLLNDLKIDSYDKFKKAVNIIVIMNEVDIPVEAGTIDDFTSNAYYVILKTVGTSPIYIIKRSVSFPTILRL